MTTLVDRLAASAQAHPDRAAFIVGDEVVDCAGLAARVDALAGWLQQARGLLRGERVLLLGPNQTGWVVAAYAVWRAGAVLVPVTSSCATACNA